MVICLKDTEWVANSVDPDQTALFAWPVFPKTWIITQPMTEIQYSLRESSNFQLSYVNISFFLRNKASKLRCILRGTRGDHSGIFVRVAGNFLEKLDGHTWCMKFAALSDDRSFQENFACETTDTFVLREKLRGSHMNPACVSHEK